MAMTHVESSIKIYFSSDYALFKMINGNRQLNEAKIKRIRNDIAKGTDVLRYCPILVKESKDGKLEIIDGQHRFWVAKVLRTKVWYIVVEDFSLHDIAKINSNTEKWKTKDYINCYIQQGNDHYKKLETFIHTYGLPFTMSVRLLSTGGIGADGGLHQGGNDDFKRGSFTVAHETEAIRFAEACKLFDSFYGWGSRPFVTAISMILKSDKCDFAELVDKFKNDTAALQKKNTAKEYLASLEEIYNFRMRTRRVIY